MFVAAAGGDRLVVVDPRGTIRWTLARPSVSDPRWFSPTGYRVAYLSRSQLRVVAGDGTGDRLVAGDVAAVAPAWRPGHAYQLAYLTRHGTLVVQDADTGRVLWTARAEGARALAWSTDGERLLEVGRQRAVAYRAGGSVLATVASPHHQPILDAAMSPDGNQLALVLGTATNELAVTALSSRGTVLRRLVTGAGLRQLAWSPDQQWLLVSWPAANQWVFIKTTGQPRIAAASRITQQFQARHGFPRLEGWCCTAKGAPS
jgi:dipeptidyl aminopeptidase/acylaminoacyl peptidase